jgi:hypothetical protein
MQRRISLRVFPSAVRRAT